MNVATTCSEAKKKIDFEKSYIPTFKLNGWSIIKVFLKIYYMLDVQRTMYMLTDKWICK